MRPPVIPPLAARDSVDVFTHWLRGDALVIVLLAIGAVLTARLVRWTADLVALRSDRELASRDALVRSEESKHRRAVAQVLTWGAVVLVYAGAGVLIVQRVGVSLAAFVPLATVWRVRDGRSWPSMHG